MAEPFIPNIRSATASRDSKRGSMNGSAILYPEGWRWNKPTLRYAIDPALQAWEPHVDTALARWGQLCGLDFVKAAHVAGADPVEDDLLIM